jgi:hypothetical protein
VAAGQLRIVRQQEDMPGFSANFFEIVIYIVPGFLVLYNFRRLSLSLTDLFQAIQTTNGAPALVALLVLAMAFGVVIAGISSIVIPFLSRVATPKPKSSMHPYEIDFARLYSRPDQTLQMFLHHMRIYQAYAHMAMAWFLSLVAFVWDSIFGTRPIDHWHFKFCVLVSFFLSMLWAAVRYFRHVYYVADKLSQNDNVG